MHRYQSHHSNFVEFEEVKEVKEHLRRQEIEETAGRRRPDRGQCCDFKILSSKKMAKNDVFDWKTMLVCSKH
jgi:hypothetical protein